MSVLITEYDLFLAGRRYVIDNKHQASLKDQSESLVASIGFILMQGSRELRSDFHHSNEGIIGHAKAASYAKELAGSDNSKLILVVIFGKEYAGAILQDGNINITGSTIGATGLLSKYLKNK
jgi:hypothetical protein